MPPDGNAVALPLLLPHVAFVCVAVSIGPVMLETFVVEVALHPAASVIVTVYEPAETFTKLCDAEPFDQLKVYGVTPELGLVLIVPFALPQVELEGVNETIGDVDDEIVLLAIAVQPFASVTVTL